MPVAELLVSSAHSSPTALVTGRTQVPQRDLSNMDVSAISACTPLAGRSGITGTYFLPRSSIRTVTGLLPGGTSLTVAL